MGKHRNFCSRIDSNRKIKEKKIKKLLTEEKKLTFKLLLTLIKEYKKLNYYFKCS